MWDVEHGLDRSGSGQGQVDVVTNLWVTYNAESFLTSWETVSFSRRIPIQAATVSEQKTDILPQDGTDRQKYMRWVPNKWKNFSHISLCVSEHLPTHQYTYTSKLQYTVLITRWPTIMIFKTCWSASPQHLLYLLQAIFFRCILVYTSVNCHRCRAVLQYTQATEDTKHWGIIIIIFQLTHCSLEGLSCDLG
jgi:hypothetical protein